MFAPAIAAVFFLGIFSKRITAQAGMWGLSVGFGLGMTRLVLVIFQGSFDPDGLLYALAAYNWGPGRIDRRLRRGGSLPRIYIEQVMKFYDAGAKVGASSRS